ncbi:MAG: beta-lactamase [Gemmatimonadetes bacterium]|nr:beta-lactamase [Gemmatimonadota bacterium]
MFANVPPVMPSRTAVKAPVPAFDSPAELHQRFAELQAKAGAQAMAVSISDLETGDEFRYHADRWFHAASTIKVAILVGVYGAIHRGELLPQSRVHVRNRFLSAADGSPYRVRLDRDANPDVHREVGRTLRVSELGDAMITTSSNLATNLLLDLVGLDVLQRTLDGFGLDGIDLRRGVEDERAFEAGINNRVTANGLVGLLRLIGEERAFSPALSRQMLDVLLGQQFNSGIPAGLPRGARVAHKTGEISTIAHDAGLVYLPDRKPYAIAVLTEWEPSAGGRSATIAAASYLAYAALVGDRD